MPEKYMKIAWSAPPLSDDDPDSRRSHSFQLLWVLWVRETPVYSPKQKVSSTQGVKLRSVCVSVPSPDKPSITQCFLPLTSFSLPYTLPQNCGAFHNLKGTALCHLPVEKRTAPFTRPPRRIGSPSCLLRAPHTFPAGLCPDARISSHLKYPLPSLWVFVFCCFLHSRHPTPSVCRCVCLPH